MVTRRSFADVGQWVGAEENDASTGHPGLPGKTFALLTQHLPPPATPGQLWQPTVNTCKVEPLGFERGAPPHHHFSVVRMGRIPQGFQIVHVSGRTADILRRAGPLPLLAHGARHLRADHDSLEDKVMLPTVPEVVLVSEHIPFIAEKFAQAPAPFVSHLRGLVGIGNSVLLLSEPEEVEMTVFPPHDLLDHSMEAREGDRAGDQEASPDRR